ncbi:MAG: type II toxin-antitoxin system VapC family toxin [Limisphaerales bacterium]
MKTYWDSSALVAALDGDPDAQASFLADAEATTRTHTLVECYSTLTGGRLGHRYAGDDAARMIASHAARMQLVDLTSAQVLDALKDARKRSARGGAVHDLMHAVCAELVGADRIATYNTSDFRALTKLDLFEP